MSASQPAFLDLEGVSRRFGDRVVLSDVTLAIPPGRITCLLGESGCGKSTLLRIISGVDRPDGGRIRMSGAEIVGPDRFVQPESRRIGFMFQDYALFPHLSVAENLAFGLRHLPKAAQRDRVAEVVARIGIAHLIDRYPHSLSGGEQQRVALARALAPQPAILLMDEPFSNLDQGLRERVRRETLATLRRIGTTAIIVTHDPQEALAVGDLIVLMRGGRIEQVGTPFEIYDRPASPYAAEFMGPCNRLTGIFSRGRIETPIGTFPADLDLPDGALALACIRPQALSIGPDGHGISARVMAKTFMGESEQIDIMVHPLAETLRMHSHVRIPMAVGEKVSLQLNGAEIHVFADDGLGANGRGTNPRETID
ncbi:ABC transporter ATP-binding protein [Paracoccus chinensis]|uniref:Iron(III) transport system ATP-binding protein n=1 Tax=Paracoccus chinensis TaxID=525640 RepID=A0A1G9LBE4_9RHOB|nr:ABC transporter ATP-binding protein [Paracoccus chinensis]SDL59156.1 iron(III) transport system ATP-binding protein [Paracoccus chinensis]